MKEISSYKIYELIGDSVGKVVSNANSYNMSFKGEDMAFRCVVSWCRDSLYKDVHVYANPDEKIELNNIASDVVISMRDEQNEAVSLLCQVGKSPNITVNDSNSHDCPYWCRRVVPFIPPQLETVMVGIMKKRQGLPLIMPALTLFVHGAGLRKMRIIQLC